MGVGADCVVVDAEGNDVLVVSEGPFVGHEQKVEALTMMMLVTMLTTMKVMLLLLPPPLSKGYPSVWSPSQALSQQQLLLMGLMLGMALMKTSNSFFR